ncbi:MAG: SprT family zinc-dependent metalloprotease [Mariprofundales bacterium]|nr:SprT family zinc-dependent metalloprotease [Mariprofundales bacterium]
MVNSNKLPTYRIRESRRAVRVAIRVLPPDGEVEVVIPSGLSHNLAPLMVEQHQRWIIKQQKKMAEWRRQPSGEVAWGDRAWNLPTQIDLNALKQQISISYHDIDTIDGIRIEQASDLQLIISGQISNRRCVASALQSYLKHCAKKTLPGMLWQTIAQSAGLCDLHLRPNRVTIRMQQSRWGSCSSRGNISLNAKLLLLPPQLVSHVILHEVAHLQIPNHSPEYWSLLNHLDPEWQRHKERLRQLERTLPVWTDRRAC